MYLKYVAHVRKSSEQFISEHVTYIFVCIFVLRMNEVKNKIRNVNYLELF